MKESHVVQFLQIISADNVMVSGGDVVCSCPFARWTHEHGSDSSPSFGVEINPEGPSRYNCFACDKKGVNLMDLLRDLSELSGRTFPEARSFLRMHESSVGSFRSGDEDISDMTFLKVTSKQDLLGGSNSPFQGMLKGGDPQSSYEDVERPKIPEEQKSHFEGFSPYPHPYLRERGFDLDTCYDWDIRTDASRYEPRIVFPVYSDDGDLLAYSKRVVWDRPKCQWCGYQDPEGIPREERTITFGGRRKDGDPRSAGGCPECDNRWIWPKYQHSKGFSRNYYLYGEHLVDTFIKTGVVVEGQLDAIWLYANGVENVVATLGSKVGVKWPRTSPKTPGEQVYQMSRLFERVILVPDGDKAGRGWVNTIRGVFDEVPDTPEVIVRGCADGHDPADLTSRQIHDIFIEHREVFTPCN